MGLWTRKSIQELQEDTIEGHHTLKKHLGAFNLVLLGIGCIIGAGLFSITGIAASQNAGPGITYSFIIASLGCGLAGLCYSELVAMIPVAGSAYTFAYATMGELIAWCIGWSLILEYAIGSAAVSISWSAYVVSFLQDFQINLPPLLTASHWQSVQVSKGTFEYGYFNLPALIIVIIINWILIRGIKESAIFNNLMVIIKVSVTLIFICLGYFYIHPANYDPFIPPNTGEFGQFGWSGVMRAAGVVFFAYIGFDAVSTAAQETKNPQRNVPIGIMVSLFICTIIYVLFALVLTGLVNYKDLDVAAPIALAIDQTPYPWLQSLIKIAIIAGLSSVMLVLLLGQSRVFYAMAKDGLLPAFFCSIHPKYQTPWRSNLILMAFVGGIGALAPLKVLGNMTSIGTLLAFVIVCLGVLVLRYTDPQLPRPFKTPFVPVTPILGILVCLTMMFSLELETWLRLILWLLVGLIFYFYYGYFHRGKNSFSS
jgi:basic amino acid/polyamine antiporter, APA family